MKTILKSLAVIALAFSLTNCGEKKETDAMGNPTDATPEVVVETENAEDAQLALGAELFKGKGTCIACHKAAEKTVGPSMKEIATIYKEKGASIAKFINEEGEPLVDAAQYEVMKANFVITKAMTQEERDALDAYMMSFQ
ncbi:c-type cytochrome [Flavobacterium ardleyense]|uniref:C-type cytochrome n=1 Tax=Flavobacterium ardleyense TaxID=2038737 RepID=A0ABW5Z7A9_9FLAO